MQTKNFKENLTHKLIPPFTPRHNGKVERAHRKDNEYFYATHKFYSFDDFSKQLAIHLKRYDSFPMRPLALKSPTEFALFQTWIIAFAILRFPKIFKIWLKNTIRTVTWPQKFRQKSNQTYWNWVRYSTGLIFNFKVILSLLE